MKFFSKTFPNKCLPTYGYTFKGDHSNSEVFASLLLEATLTGKNFLSHREQVLSFFPLKKGFIQNRSKKKKKKKKKNGESNDEKKYLFEKI